MVSGLLQALRLVNDNKDKAARRVPDFFSSIVPSIEVILVCVRMPGCLAYDFRCHLMLMVALIWPFVYESNDPDIRHVNFHLDARAT